MEEGTRKLPLGIVLPVLFAFIQLVFFNGTREMGSIVALQMAKGLDPKIHKLQLEIQFEVLRSS